MKEKLGQIGAGSICPIIVIVRDGKILMGLRNYTDKEWKNETVWTVPGGRCEEGETIEMTLRRELLEETGIKNLEITDYLGGCPGVRDGDSLLIFGGTTGEEAKLMEPDKFTEWKWHPIEAYLNGTVSKFNPEAEKLIAGYLRSLL